MISIIEDECVAKKKWITADDMMNITVLAESTPGPVAINCATFVGYKQKGIIGSIVATIGMVIPSFVIIYVISLVLDSFLEIAIVANAFQGIKLAVGILIIDAALKMIKKMPKKAFPITVMICATVAMILINAFAIKFSVIAMMLIAAAISLAIFIVKSNGKANKSNGEGQPKSSNFAEKAGGDK